MTSYERVSSPIWLTWANKLWNIWWKETHVEIIKHYFDISYAAIIKTVAGFFFEWSNVIHIYFIYLFIYYKQCIKMVVSFFSIQDDSNLFTHNGSLIKSRRKHFLPFYMFKHKNNSAYIVNGIHTWRWIIHLLKHTLRHSSCQYLLIQRLRLSS